MTLEYVLFHREPNRRHPQAQITYYLDGRPQSESSAKQGTSRNTSKQANHRSDDSTATSQSCLVVEEEVDGEEEPVDQMPLVK